MSQYRSAFFSVLLILSLFSFGCATTKNEKTETPGLSSTKIYSNDQGFDISIVNNILQIKYYKESTYMGNKMIVQSVGLYNPGAGLLALGPNTMKWPRYTKVTFYKIKNEKFREILDEIVANPSAYIGSRELDKFFNGDLPGFTRDGKYEGLEIIEKIDLTRALMRMHDAGFDLRVTFDGPGVYFYDYGREMFVRDFGGLSDLLGIKLKVKFLPQITNNSGFQISEKYLVTHELMKNNGTAPYQIKVVPVNESYELEIQPAMYEVEYTKKEIEINPTVLIKKKRIHTYNPNYMISNDELDVVITKIDAVAKYRSGNTVAEDLSVTLDISNKSNKYVDTEAISLYFNNDIYTFNVKYKLPPMSKQEKITLRTKEIDYIRKVDANEALARYLSLEESKKISTSIGASVGYIINGSEQNLFKKSNISLYDMMSEAY